MTTALWMLLAPSWPSWSGGWSRQTINAAPWEEQRAGEVATRRRRAPAAAGASRASWMFLAVVTSLFALLISAY